MGIRDILAGRATKLVERTEEAWTYSASIDYLDQCFQVHGPAAARTITWMPARRATFTSQPEPAFPASIFAYLAAQALRNGASGSDVLALQDMLVPLAFDLPAPTEAQTIVLTEAYGWCSALAGTARQKLALRLAILRSLM